MRFTPYFTCEGCGRTSPDAEAIWACEHSDPGPRPDLPAGTPVLLDARGLKDGLRYVKATVGQVVLVPFLHHYHSTYGIEDPQRVPYALLEMRRFPDTGEVSLWGDFALRLALAPPGALAHHVWAVSLSEPLEGVHLSECWGEGGDDVDPYFEHVVDLSYVLDPAKLELGRWFPADQPLPEGARGLSEDERYGEHYRMFPDNLESA